jgi:Holliday junction resolvase RusA-like endonuclease
MEPLLPVKIKAAFTIDGTLPSLNEIIDAAKNNRFGYAELKRNLLTAVAAYIRRGRMPKFDRPVKVTIDWYERNHRRDLDNIIGGGTKPILDALVVTGILPNDTQRWIRSIANHFPAPDPKLPRIVVSVETVEDPDCSGPPPSKELSPF